MKHRREIDLRGVIALRLRPIALRRHRYRAVPVKEVVHRRIGPVLGDFGEVRLFDGAGPEPFAGQIGRRWTLSGNQEGGGAARRPSATS